jgi:thioredoxin-related protein
MIDRRLFSAGLLAAALSGPAHAAPRLADDGMYEFDWYLESFLDLADDVAAAQAGGKRLAIMFGQRACPYCRRMAEEHLSDERISAYIRKHFEVLHLNLFGAREVTDFDGRKMSERDLARTYGVRLTPAILFFPESSDGLGAKPPMKREVARMPGLLEPPQFLAMFRFVAEKGYEKASFQQWLASNGG